MKKKMILPIALVALPVVAMMAAFAPDAVRYIYSDGTLVQMPFLGMPEGVNTALCMPAAVIAVGICIFFAMAYAFSGKPVWLKGIPGCAFAAALLAVVPYLIQSENRAFPSVVVPIAMMLEWLVAYVLGKDVETAPAQKEKGRRLGKN